MPCRMTNLFSPAHGEVSSSFMSVHGLLESPEWPGGVRRRPEIDAARARIGVLKAQVRELLAQRQRNSSNSSTTPSANPRTPPKPVVIQLTGQRPGAQTGHRGHHRLRLPTHRSTGFIVPAPTDLRRLSDASAIRGRTRRSGNRLAPTRRTAQTGGRRHRRSSPRPHLSDTAIRSTTPRSPPK